MTTARNWLLDESPASKLQANMGNAYRMLLQLLRNPLAVVGALILLMLILAALFAPWIAPQNPLGQNLDARLLPPSAAHWMGTDELGRDIFSRVIYGARITLMIVALVAIIAAPLGLLIGAILGYFGGWIPLDAQADPRAGLCRRTRAGDRECHHRHRHYLLARLCADRAG